MPARRKTKKTEETKWHDTAQVKALKDIWYKKLEDAGFDDIEQDEEKLKVWSTIFFARYNKTTVDAKIMYAQMAENFLREYRFDSDLDKVIWEYHSTNLSYRDITAILKKVKIKTNRTYVGRIINRLKKSMFAMYMVDMGEYHE